MAAGGGRSPELRRSGQLISVNQPTQKTMKKIALILILPLVLSLAAVAAQKKDASKKSTESATSEQHVVLNPADLKWGMRRPGYRPGRNWRCWLVIQTRRDCSQCGCKPRLVTRFRRIRTQRQSILRKFPARLTLARETSSMKQLGKRWALAATWSCRRG